MFEPIHQKRIHFPVPISLVSEVLPSAGFVGLAEQREECNAQYSMKISDKSQEHYEILRKVRFTCFVLFVKHLRSTFYRGLHR